MAESQGSLMMVRMIKAPIADVFKAWTDPKLFARFMGSDEWIAGTTEMDPRVGGKYRFEVHDPKGGPPHVTSGEYLEIVPNRRIVKTWIYSGPMKQFEGAVTRLTVELRVVRPDCTELTLKHEDQPNAAYSESTREGWTGCLDQLEKMLADENTRNAR